MRKPLLGIAACLLTGLAAPAQVGNFTLPLNLTNVQVAKVIIGCHEQATDDFDRAQDIPIPPFGMGTGTVKIIPQATQTPPLYQDLRSNRLPQTWNLSLTVRPGKPVTMTWNHTALPQGTELTLTLPNRRPVSLRNRKRWTFNHSGTFSLTVRTSTARTSQQKVKKP